MSADKLQPSEFLILARSLPMVDVRSPREFAQGHILGSHSIPLFDDEERAMVGITYTGKGNQDAVLKGLEIIGPKLQGFVRQAKKIASDGKILVHCWRGGMRSEAMAWLFNFAGLKASVLEGGYKAYRKYIRESFEQGPEMKILGGMTGSGKTEMLHELAKKGEQVIDLEALAHHKGSAFGALGLDAQPTTEQFENNLALQWMALDTERPVWLEDESLNIGRVVLPIILYQKMQDAKLYFLDLPFETRVDRLLNEYGHFDKEELRSIIEHISRRMGGDKAKSAIDSLIHDDIRRAIEIVLTYYDKTYQYSLSNRKSEMVIFTF